MSRDLRIEKFKYGQKNCARGRFEIEIFHVGRPVTPPNVPPKKPYIVRDTTTSLFDRIYDEKKIFYILNFASQYVPGGAVKRGMHGQEEHLCIQFPDLYRSLDASRNAYHIRDKIIVTRNVWQYFTDDFTITSSPRYANFITASALDARNCSRWDLHDTKEKLRLALSVIPRGATVILGAWGCGCYAPRDRFLAKEYKQDMAQLLKEVTEEYSGLFEAVYFPIPDLTNFNLFLSTFDE